MSLATAGLAVCWDANDVARWLDNNELGIYAGSFLANDIDGKTLFSESTFMNWILICFGRRMSDADSFFFSSAVE